MKHRAIYGVVLMFLLLFPRFCQAQGGPVTFAQFTAGAPGTSLQTTGTGNAWTSSRLGTTGAYAVSFIFTAGGATSPTLQATPFGTPINAYLSYSAVTLPLSGTNSPYAAVFGSGGFQSASQSFSVVTLTIKANGTQTVGSVTIPDGANLLSMTSGTGSDPNNIGGFLSVSIGSSSGTFQGSTITAASPTNKVAFSSDYLDFSSTAEEAYALALIGVDPMASLGGPLSKQYINAFDATTTGTFSANFGAALSVTAAKLDAPQWIRLPLAKEYSITVHLKGSGRGVLHGVWLLDGQPYQAADIVEDLTNGSWIVGPTLDIPWVVLLGNHTLQFTINSQSGPTTTPLECSVTGFDPAVDGWRFVNAFPQITGLSGFVSKLLGAADGFCMGMSRDARSHFVYGPPIPQDSTLPRRYSGLWWRLYFSQVVGFQLFTNIDLNRLGLDYEGDGNREMQGETERVMQRLQDGFTSIGPLGDPTVMALFVNADGTGGGHAVLATAAFFDSDIYTDSSPDETVGIRRFFISDPNWAGEFESLDVYDSGNQHSLSYTVPGINPALVVHYLYEVTF